MAQKVEYVVEVSRTGNGAVEAAAQLTQLNAAATAVNKNLAVSSAAFGSVEKVTKSATAGLKALSSVGFLVFPQVTIGAMAVNESLKALKLASAAAGTSIGAMAGPIAVIVAGFATVHKSVKEYLSMMSAMEAEHQSQVDLSASAANQAKRINDALISAMQEGRVKLSAERIATWDAILGKPSPEALAKIRQTISQEMPNLFLSESDRSKIAGQAIADSERQMQLAISIAQAAGNTKVAEEELNGVYSQRLTLLNDLQEKGLLTNKEVADAAANAAIAENQRMTQLRAHLTDIQQLEIQVAQNFASGMSTALVEFASKTKSAEEAFRQFAVSFLQQTAQMILQLAIMRMLFGASGLSSGTGGLIGGLINGAAAGGQFSPGGARRMAVGGVAELTQPTYFPRFNVLAGEAGREVMTVMARPRLMNVGGIAAQVGDVGPNRLALTNAGDLQSIGNGQRVHVDLAVHFDDGLEAKIVGKSANASLNLVTRKMGERSALSEKTRRLMGS